MHNVCFLLLRVFHKENIKNTTCINTLSPNTPFSQKYVFIQITSSEFFLVNGQLSHIGHARFSTKTYCELTVLSFNV